MTFRRILTFYSSWEGCLSCATDGLVGLVLNFLALFFDLSVREGGILFGRAVLGLGATHRCTTGGQDVDDSNVNVLRSVRVSTMQGHAVRLPLQQPHGLFIQGNQRVERIVARQFHGQLPVDVDLGVFIVVDQKMWGYEVRIGQVERSANPDVGTGPLGSRRYDARGNIVFTETSRAGLPG